MKIVHEDYGGLNVQLREYRESDFLGLATLYKLFFNEMREWQGWGALKLEDKQAEKIARESLNHNSLVFVAEEKGNLVGFARIQLWDGAYFVREVFVKKSCRRRGVGSSLLAKCEEEVGRAGETSLYLMVEPKNLRSLNFLVKNGFDTLNTIELRKDFAEGGAPEREGEIQVLGIRLRLLKRKIL
ncbi:MAG: GNAT family N-acetyltransferase [Thermoproteota archaeon]|nr:GNAT family N-acetyltransferase [Thermoproteota archaeon]